MSQWIFHPPFWSLVLIAFFSLKPVNECVSAAVLIWCWHIGARIVLEIVVLVCGS